MLTALTATQDAQARESIPGSLAAPLVLHEGISPGGCPRWPEHLRLRSSEGELVPGRCKASNQCEYCARLAAVENAELLALDAINGEAPRVWAVLTTRSADPDPASFYKSRELVLRDLRKAFSSQVQVASLVEFTTGYGPRSGGRRRPHWNLTFKGLDPDRLDQVHDVVADRWCSREDALPARQWVDSIESAGGLMRYIALHFQKESQRPPPGWRGHRFTASRGYLWTRTPEARKAAKESLRWKRELHKALKDGYQGEAADDVAKARCLRAKSLSWELVQVMDLASDPQAREREWARRAMVRSLGHNQGAR